MVAAVILIAMRKWDRITVGDATKLVKIPAEQTVTVVAVMLITAAMSEMTTFRLPR